MSIIDWPPGERPRERLLASGAQALSDAELLALFLRVGVRGKSAVDLGRDLISRFGSRKEEYEADAYACHLGLGRELAGGLLRIESIYGGGNSGFFQSLMNDHPDTPKRIERIRKIMGDKHSANSDVWD